MRAAPHPRAGRRRATAGVRTLREEDGPKGRRTAPRRARKAGSQTGGLRPGNIRGSARLGSARLGSARLGSARLGSARLGSARLGSARLGSARLGSARLGSARLGSARLGSARLLIILPASPGSDTSAFKNIASSLHDCRRGCRRVGPEPCTRCRTASTEAAESSGQHDGAKNARTQGSLRGHSGVPVGAPPARCRRATPGRAAGSRGAPARSRSPGGRPARGRRGRDLSRTGAALGQGRDFAYPMSPSRRIHRVRKYQLFFRIINIHIGITCRRSTATGMWFRLRAIYPPSADDKGAIHAGWARDWPALSPLPPGEGPGVRGGCRGISLQAGRYPPFPHPKPLSRGERGFPSLQRKMALVSSTGPTTANRSLPCDRGPTRRDRGQRHPAPDRDRGVTVPADSRPGSKPPAFFRRYREDRTVRSVAGTASGRRLRPGTSERGRSSLPARRPRAPSGGGWSDRTPPEPARPAMLPIPRAVSGISRQARARIDLLRQPRRPPAPAFVRLRPPSSGGRGVSRTHGAECAGPSAWAVGIAALGDSGFVPRAGAIPGLRPWTRCSPSWARPRPAPRSGPRSRRLPKPPG